MPSQADSRPSSSVGPRALLFILTLAAGLFLFPIESDAALASDGVWFGADLEVNPQRAVRGNHPLFHLVAWPLATAARALGFAHPGHVAFRVVAAAGAAALVTLVAAFGGRRAAWFGLAAAGYVLASRMFVIESATGENVPPATAAAAAVAFAALHHRRRLVLVGTLLALALTLRQDNILLVPGVVLTTFPRGRKALPALRFLAAVAVPVLGVYAFSWRLAAPEVGFMQYLLGLGAHGSWPSTDPTSPPVLLLQAVVKALIGRHWSFTTSDAFLGLACLLVPLAVAASRSGIRRTTCEAALFGIPVVARALFYGWFEPGNPEWQVFAIAFSCAAAARLARLSRPGPALRIRTAIMAVAAAAVLASHIRFTLALRHAVYKDAVLAAVAAAPPDAVLVIGGTTAAAIPALLGLPYERLDGSPAEAWDQLARIARRNPSRAVLAIGDRFVLDAEPYSMTHRSEAVRFNEDAVDGGGIRYLRWEGLVYGVVLSPAPSTGR